MQHQLRDYGIVNERSKIHCNNQAAIAMMQVLHSSSIRGHSGVYGSYQRAKAPFYWKGMKKDFVEFISCYDVCKACKDEQVPDPGLLQPLAIP